MPQINEFSWMIWSLVMLLNFLFILLKFFYLSFKFLFVEDFKLTFSFNFLV